MVDSGITCQVTKGKNIITYLTANKHKARKANMIPMRFRDLTRINGSCALHSIQWIHPQFAIVIF